MLYHWLLRCPAWLDLDCVARCAYIALAQRYAGQGSNNGKIPFSVRELALELKVGKSTAQRALNVLIEHGFIEQTSKGAFNIKHRHASEWLLTEFGDDRPGRSPIASRAFMRWKKNKTRYRAKYRTIPILGRNGISCGTVSISNYGLRFHAGYRGAKRRYR